MFLSYRHATPFVSPSLPPHSPLTLTCNTHLRLADLFVDVDTACFMSTSPEGNLAESTFFRLIKCKPNFVASEPFSFCGRGKKKLRFYSAVISTSRFFVLR